MEGRERIGSEPQREEGEPEMYWDTQEKSRVITPHLWNDYARLDRDVYNVLTPPDVRYTPSAFYDLVHRTQRPPLLADRWQIYPDSAPKESLGPLDQEKVKYLDQISDKVASLRSRLIEVMKDVPVKREGNQGQNQGYLVTDLASPEFKENQEAALALLNELKENIAKVRTFFYHDNI